MPTYVPLELITSKSLHLFKVSFLVDVLPDLLLLQLLLDATFLRRYSDKFILPSNGVRESQKVQMRNPYRPPTVEK